MIMIITNIIYIIFKKFFTTLNNNQQLIINLQLTTAPLYSLIIYFTKSNPILQYTTLNICISHNTFKNSDTHALADKLDNSVTDTACTRF